MSTFAAGLIAIVAILVFTYLGFTKFANPFASPYTVHADLRERQRPAPELVGADRGRQRRHGQERLNRSPGCKVTASQKCDAAEVTMVIQKQGLPLHDDATFAIRPRIFLEGNFFVDVHPGTPEAPVANSGHTFPIQQGTEPVQTDQVLTSLQADTRKNLQILLQQYGTAVKQARHVVQPLDPVLAARLQVLGDRRARRAGDPAPRPVELDRRAGPGGRGDRQQPAEPAEPDHRLQHHRQRVRARRTWRSRTAVAALPKTLAAAIPAFNALNAAFPPLRTLAKALIPGVKSTGPMIDASLPLMLPAAPAGAAVRAARPDP